MKDLNNLNKPHTITYNQKNDIKPFEDHGKFERYGKKNDASMFTFGSHSKKRPNNIVIGRLYDFHLLDMIEFGIENFESINSFKNSKVTSGAKPCLLFSGEEFADTTNAEMQRIKSLFIDFFRGDEVTNVRLAGIEHVLQESSPLTDIDPYYSSQRLDCVNLFLRFYSSKNHIIASYLHWIYQPHEL